MANRYVSFGYEITDGKYAVVEQEKGIVESIFGLYINGKSFAEISERMNEAGTPCAIPTKMDTEKLQKTE